MNLTQKQKRVIVIILAFILIATGALQIVFNIQFNEQIVKFMQMIILLVAFYLLCIPPKKK